MLDFAWLSMWMFTKSKFFKIYSAIHSNFSAISSFCSYIGICKQATNKMLIHRLTTILKLVLGWLIYIKVEFLGKFKYSDGFRPIYYYKI